MLSILKKCIRIFNRECDSGCWHLLWCGKPPLWLSASSPVKWRAWQHLLPPDHARAPSAQGSTQSSRDAESEMTVKGAQSCPTLQPCGLYSPWNSPGQNTGVGSFSLLQGIFPTQGSNPGFPHCRWILYHLSHKGSPGILEWVAFPISRGSSQHQTGVFCIAGGFYKEMV